MRFQLNSILLFSFIILIGLTNCTENQNQQDESMEGLPADFLSFYKQFHHDSTFQMAHIAFPLQGIRGPNNLDSSETFIPWQKVGWKLHKPIDNLIDYQKTFDVLSSDLIVETIEQRGAPIAMQRRFALMADGWHLIYYIEMQPMSRQESQ